VNGTILVADDETVVRSMLVVALEAAGYRVLAASDGQEAVDLYRDHADEIMVSLLDLTMPRMGGDEAFREIVRIRPQAQVLLSSGFTASETLRGPGGERPAGFVQKPYRVSELVSTLSQLLHPGIQ